MEKKAVLSLLNESGVIAVIRWDSSEGVLQSIRILLKAGVRFIELTTTIPKVFDLAAKALAEFDTTICLGIGTVLNADDANRAVSSGCQFIVSPVFDRDVVSLCNKSKVVVVPGAYTPQEAFIAWKNGADVVKLFPANLGGTMLLEAIREPMPQIKFITTHGHAENAAEFVKAGATAVCFGGAALGLLIRAKNFIAIEKNALDILTAVRSVKHGSK